MLNKKELINMRNVNTPATAKIVYNKQLNTFRVLVAFNTTQVTVQNAAYQSGDLLVYTNQPAVSIIHALQSAMRTLSINVHAILHLQFTNQALAQLSPLNTQSIYMPYNFEL
jgi:hypothetical protein